MMRWVSQPDSSENSDFHLSFSNLGTAAPRASSAGLLTVRSCQQLDLPAWKSFETAIQKGELLIAAVQRGSLYADTEQLQGILFQGQMCMLSSSKQLLRFVPHSDSRCIVLVLSGDPVQTVASTLASQRVFCRKGILMLLSVLSVLEEPDATPEQISSAAYQLLMYLREHAECYEETAGYPTLVEAALGILQEEFAHVDGINEVADRLGVSLNHLVRQFSLHMGISPGKYLKLRKLEYAKLLLRNPELTVNLVSALSGFSNANYFAKAFRKEFGVSPSEYRTAHQTAPIQVTEKQLDEIYL